MREGYKKTEIGLVPLDWEVVKLENLCNFYLGLTYTPKYVDNGVPFLSVKDITKGYLSFEKTKYISYEEFENSTSNAKPKKGDVIFGRVGTLGRPLIVETDMDFCIFVSLGFIRVNESIYNRYLQQWMTSNDFTKQVNSKVIGSAQKNLNVGWLRSFKIPLPPLNQQKEIAQILSTADEKIEAIALQIEKSETVKKGLMQRLLNQVEKNTFLKEILTIKYGKNQKKVEDKNGQYPILGTGGLMGYANSYLYDKPSVLIGRKGTIDKPQFMETPFWTVDTLFYTEIKEDTFPKWLFYVFQTINWRRHNEASGVPSLSLANIHNIKVFHPPLKEQTQIANILSTADEKLEVLRAKKAKYEELKVGLMQKLLTGEVRV